MKAEKKYTREDFKKVLLKTSGNKTEAAKIFGMPRTTFREQLNKFSDDFVDIDFNPGVETEKEKSKPSIAKPAIEKALNLAQGNKAEAARILGVPRTTFNDQLNKYDEGVEGFYRKLKKSKVYIFTSAQNVTPVFRPFHTNLLRCKDYLDAELMVIPIRYKNPTSIFTDQQKDDDWWAEELQPYLCESRQDIGNNLQIMADVKVIPTAVTPLSGFDAMSQDKSCIFGHNKITFKTVAVPSHALPKIIATTGSITQNNFTDSKVGKKGEEHHVYGAIIVETDGDEYFHMRHINALEDGSFIDLDKEYKDGEVHPAPPAAGLVIGDLHGQFADPGVLNATFRMKNNIVDLLNPEYLVWHDVLDFYAANHHHRDDPFMWIKKVNDGTNLVEKEVRSTFKLVSELSKGRKSIFPASNHPDALARWIKDTDWKADPMNAPFYLKTASYLAENPGSCPFEYWGKQLLDDVESATFLDRNSGFMIKNIDVGSHGDVGPNGARGSLLNMSRLGVKSVIGHSHSPGIRDGCFQVGTSSLLRLEYNRGPSSWLHSHCIIYANGKRSLINIINGKFSNFNFSERYEEAA